jgi:hypothetical protein
MGENAHSTEIVTSKFSIVFRAEVIIEAWFGMLYPDAPLKLFNHERQTELRCLEASSAGVSCQRLVKKKVKVMLSP